MTRWTTQADAELETRWRRGEDDGQIASSLGVTRASVAGRRTRLGFAGRDASGGLQTRYAVPAPSTKQRLSAQASLGNLVKQKKLSTGRFGPGGAEPIPAGEPVVSDALGKTLAQLHSRSCRWPVSNPAPGHGDTMLFCAAVTDGLDESYCPHHARWSAQATVQEMRDAAAKGGST